MGHAKNNIIELLSHLPFRPHVHPSCFISALECAPRVHAQSTPHGMFDSFKSANAPRVYARHLDWFKAELRPLFVSPPPSGAAHGLTILLIRL